MLRPALATRLPSGFALLACLTVYGCDEEQSAATIDTTPIVGVMEVPITLRNDGATPAAALRIEANQSELRLDSQPIYVLERGRIPAAEIQADGPTKLRAAIAASPTRQRAALTLHGMVGYGTLARTVQALTTSGYQEIAIAVRPVSTTGTPPTTMSWMTWNQITVAPDGPAPVDPATYPQGTVRPWHGFTEHWDESYQACRAGRYIDCDPAPLATPEDGFLQVVLWARGQGMQVRFHRVGAPPPVAAQPRAVEMIEGVQAQPAGAGQEAAPTPVATGAFTFRQDVATTAESAISSVTRPVCGAAPCPTVIEADEETPVMRVLSLLGAAFPNGVQVPILVLRLPEQR